MTFETETSAPPGVTDLMAMTQALHADLMTAKASNDPDIVHASLIAAVEGLLTCVRTLASELVKIELEGIETRLPGAG